jgi:hypothetical protein
VAHKGQSSVCFKTFGVLSSVWACTIITPMLEQINSIAFGLTSGDAMATPIDSANQTSTKRAISLMLIKKGMAAIMQAKRLNYFWVLYWALQKMRCRHDFAKFLD